MQRTRPPTSTESVDEDQHGRNLDHEGSCRTSTAVWFFVAHKWLKSNMILNGHPPRQTVVPALLIPLVLECHALVVPEEHLPPLMVPIFLVNATRLQQVREPMFIMS